MDHEYVQFYINDENINEDIENMNENIENIENVESGSDELLIDAVRGYLHLYDSSLKECKDIQMKENSWREIAILMEMPVATCQNRWQRLRERFTKEQRLQEAESRSGSGVSRRPIFALYNNMLFLKNHIKRRKSFTNVKNSIAKKRTDNMPNLSSNECNSIDNSISHQFTSNIHSKGFNSFSRILKDKSVPSGSSLYADCNIMSQELNSRSTNSFDSHIQKINRQTEQNPISATSMPQKLNRFETRLESTSPPRNESHNSSCISSEIAPSVSRNYTSTLAPPLRNESRNSSCINSEIASPSESRDYTSTLAPPLRTESRNSSCINSEIASPSESRDYTSSFAPTVRSTKDNTGKIKNKSNAYLESSLVSLSNTIQNRIANRSVSEQAWNLNNLTPDKSFGLLVATELERLPEVEKSKRKQAIVNILWNSTQ